MPYWESSAGAAAVRRLILALALTRVGPLGTSNRLLRATVRDPAGPTGMTRELCGAAWQFSRHVCGSVRLEARSRDQEATPDTVGRNTRCCCETRGQIRAGRGRIPAVRGRTATTTDEPSAGCLSPATAFRRCRIGRVHRSLRPDRAAALDPRGAFRASALIGFYWDCSRSNTLFRPAAMPLTCGLPVEAETRTCTPRCLSGQRTTTLTIASENLAVSCSTAGGWAYLDPGYDRSRRALGAHPDLRAALSEPITNERVSGSTIANHRMTRGSAGSTRSAFDVAELAIPQPRRRFGGATFRATHVVERAITSVGCSALTGLAGRRTGAAACRLTARFRFPPFGRSGRGHRCRPYPRTSRRRTGWTRVRRTARSSGPRPSNGRICPTPSCSIRSVSIAGSLSEARGSRLGRARGRVQSYSRAVAVRTDTKIADRGPPTEESRASRIVGTAKLAIAMTNLHTGAVTVGGPADVRRTPALSDRQGCGRAL